MPPARAQRSQRRLAHDEVWSRESLLPKMLKSSQPGHCSKCSARIWLSNLARQSKNTVSSAAAIPVDAITAKTSLIPFISFPPSCSARRLCADNVAKRTLELDAEELELARRYSKSLCEAHHPATVEQRQDSVFSIQQRIHQFVDPSHIASERLSKGHASRLPVRRYPGAQRAAARAAGADRVVLKTTARRQRQFAQLKPSARRSSFA